MVKKMIFFSIVLFPQLSFATSFDCAKASTEIEKLICFDSQLSDLDDVLSKEYSSLLSRSSIAIRQNIVHEQRQWLREERNSCHDSACLKSRYKARLETIKQKHFDTGKAPFVKVNIFDIDSPPVGRGHPSIFEQIEGDLVYSHYDNTGNSKNLVQFDFTTGRWANLLVSQKEPKLIAQNTKYIVYHVPHSASYPIKVMDRTTGKLLSETRLKKPVFNAFIEDDRLILFQTAEGAYNNHKQAIAIFSLSPLKLIKETTIHGAHLLGISDNYIYTSFSGFYDRDLIIYDHKLNAIKRVAFPEAIEKVNAGCGSSIKQDGTKWAILVTHCGEIHILNLKSFSIEHSIPRFSHFYSMALYNDLIFAVGQRQKKDYSNPITVYDMTSGKHVANLPINADHIAIKGNILLAVNRPAIPRYGKKPYWSMSTYAINTESIRTGDWQVNHTSNECQQAESVIKNSGSIYDAITICKAAGIEQYAESKTIPDGILPTLRQYALWLSHTFDKTSDAIRILERVSREKPDSEIASALLESRLKHRTIDENSAGELSITELNTNFGQLLMNGDTLPNAVTKSIEFGFFPDLFHFSDNRIYVGRNGCATRDCTYGTAIGVFNRNTLDEIGTIPIAKSDDMYQDGVSSIATDESNIYATVEYRYPDDGLKEGRPNFFVIDKENLKISYKTRLATMGGLIPDSGQILLCGCPFSTNRDCAIIDPSNLGSLSKSEKKCVGYIRDEIKVYDFKLPDHSNPSVTAITKDYFLVREGLREETVYSVYSKAGKKISSIATNLPNLLNHHTIPNSNDLLVSERESTMGGIKFTLISLPSGTSRDLFALPTKSRNPIITTYEKTLYVGYGRDLLVFDLSKYHLTRYIKDFIPNGFKDNGHGVDTNKIVRLIIDQGRLIALNFRGNNCRVADLADL